MNKLLYANLQRLRKNKVFWLGLIVTIGYSLLQFLSQYQFYQKYKGEPMDKEWFSLDGIAFGCLIVIGIVFSVVVSMYVGTDYSDGTIRNKIIVGKSRRCIYFSNFLICAGICLLIYILGILTSYVFGRPVFGEFANSWEKIAMYVLAGGFVSITYAALFNLVAMLNTSKVHGVVISILLAFGMFFLTVYFFNELSQPEMIESVEVMGGDMSMNMIKNPQYPTGLQRKIYQFLMDFLPTAQAAQVANLQMEHPVGFFSYSILLTVICNLGGYLVFKKKNLK